MWFFFFDMGSSAAVSPLSSWSPYETYKDCSTGICSIYCPQSCYIIFPPPPPVGEDDSSGTTFSPLIIAIIGILASAFLLVSYYTIVTRYCRRRGSRNPRLEFDTRHDEVHQEQWQVAAAGLDESVIKSITLFKYRKIDKLVEGTECAVCLNEFQEEENLRLLPKCCHAFHPPCIDTWLKSQSNCPLCRANVNPHTPVSTIPPAAANPQTSSSTIDIYHLEVQRESDLVYVIEDQEREVSVVSAVSLSHVCDDDLPKSPLLQADIEMENSEERNLTTDDDQDRETHFHFRRSISLGAFSCHRHLLVADILKIDDEEHDEYNREGISESGIGIGSSKVNPAAMKRCFSTGRFNFSWHDDDKGKRRILPN